MVKRRPVTRFVSSLLVLVIMVMFSAAGYTQSKQASPESVASQSGMFVWLSDIHFDPFYYGAAQNEGKVSGMIAELVDSSGNWKDGSEWGAVFSQGKYPWQSQEYAAPGNDANHRLLQEVVLQSKKRSAPGPNFILITGDLLGHSLGANYAKYAPSNMQTAAFYHDFVTQTVKYIAFSVNRGSLPARPNLPVPPIYSTLGNNDANCGDYAIHLDFMDSEFLGKTAETFLTYFMPQLSASDKQAFRDSFSKGGYYSVPIPNAGSDHRLLVINSIPFMGKYPDNDHYGNYPVTEQACNNADTNYEIDASKQLDWLKTQAENADRAWIATHVPPGFDCFSHTPSNPSSNWLSNHLSAFRDLFLDAGTSDNLAGAMAGHSHMSSFKLIRDDNGNAVSQVLQGSSVSPIFKNNPGFGIVRYDRDTLEMNSYQMHYLDRSQPGTVWSHFQFAGISGAVDAGSIDSLYQSLGQDSRDWATFQSDYGSRAGSVVKMGNLSQSNLGCLNSLQ